MTPPSVAATPEPVSNMKQDKACSTASVDVIRQALLQQTATWDDSKRSALERFFERPRAAATAAAPAAAVTAADHTFMDAAAMAGTGTAPTAATIYDLMRPPASARRSVGRPAEGSGPLRHAAPATRFQPYGRPANRTGAGHLNSGQPRYSSSGRSRPLTPMPPKGTAPIGTAEILLQDAAPTSAAGAAGPDTCTQQLDQADQAGPASTNSQPDASYGAVAFSAPLLATSLFSRTAGAVTPAGSSNGAPGDAAAGDAFASQFPLGPLPPARGAAAGLFGGSAAAATDAAGNGLMGLQQANLVLGSKPLLGGLGRRSRPPLMGARRGGAARGPSGAGSGGGKVLGPAAWRSKSTSGDGRIQPMRSTPLKLTGVLAPAAGSKRTADVAGPISISRAEERIMQTSRLLEQNRTPGSFFQPPEAPRQPAADELGQRVAAPVDAAGAGGGRKDAGSVNGSGGVRVVVFGRGVRDTALDRQVASAPPTGGPEGSQSLSGVAPAAGFAAGAGPVSSAPQGKQQGQRRPTFSALDADDDDDDEEDDSGDDPKGVDGFTAPVGSSDLSGSCVAAANGLFGSAPASWAQNVKPAAATAAASSNGTVPSSEAPAAAGPLLGSQAALTGETGAA
eukprot:gene7115-7329_t